MTKLKDDMIMLAKFERQMEWMDEKEKQFGNAVEDNKILRELLIECAIVLSIALLAFDKVDVATWSEVESAENAINTLLAKLPDWAKK